MRIAAVICEYNPFHNGHKYHIDQTRSAGATHIVCVMSGNFTQRGDIAIFDKYERARTALENGADLILELPSRISLSSAESFAAGAVNIIENLGCVETLSFGSECGDLSRLKEAAGASEYAAQSDFFKNKMRNGSSYPSALSETVREFYTDDVCDVLNEPNNTLAIEYIKALDNIGSGIKLFTVQRKGAEHDGKNAGDEFASASFIREKIERGEDYSLYAPLVNSPKADIHFLERAILANLRSMKKDEFEEIYDCAQGLAQKLYKASRYARSLEELYFLTKTKRYTLAKIRRAVICCFLGITKKRTAEKSAYIRILGMNTRGKEILSAAKCSLPMDTSLKALMGKSREAYRQGKLEERCGDIYSLAFEKPYPCGREFTAKPVIIE